MGREARCAVSHDGQKAEAKALLETDELIVRSPFRLSVPRAGIRSATAAGDALEVVYDGGALTLGWASGRLRSGRPTSPTPRRWPTSWA